MENAGKKHSGMHNQFYFVVKGNATTRRGRGTAEAGEEDEVGKGEEEEDDDDGGVPQSSEVGTDGTMLR
jgi:hypothetical protein